MKILTFFGFLVEVTLFISAGYLMFYSYWLYLFVASMGLIIGFIIGQRIADEAIEDYKKIQRKK